MITAIAPGPRLELKVGMAFHLHSWFASTRCADYFVSNTVIFGEHGAEILTSATPETLLLR